MAEPYNYLGLMGGTGELSSIPEALQQAVLGRQTVQRNQSILDEQARADEARKAMARLVLRGQPSAGQQPAPGGDVTVTHGGALPMPGAQVAPAPQDSGSDAADLALIAQADPAAAQAIILNRQMLADKAKVMRAPTAANIAHFGMAHPDQFKDMKSGWDMLDGSQKQAATQFFADAYGYLSSGDVEGAKASVQRHIDAERAAGQDTSEEEAFLTTLGRNPNAARAVAGMNLSVGMGPEKFADAYKAVGSEARDNQVQPYKVRQEAAKASQEETTAQFAPEKAQSDIDTAVAQRQRWASQTANEVADLAIKRSGLDLERDKLESTIQLELEKLDRAGTSLDASGRQAVNTAVGESVAASALADRMNGLADRIHGANPSSGWKAAFYEKGKGAFGAQDAVSGLRSEYNQLVNAQAVKNLPPGPASDKDIALAKQGFPPDTANAAYLESFLRGMAKMQQAVAAASDRKANWISSNGSLAPSRRDIDVGGVQVPAGTTFSEFNGNAVKRGRQGDLPAGIAGINQKYGGR